MPAEASGRCPSCLRLVDAAECPSEDEGNTLPNCDDDAGLAIGAMCEGDGECNTTRTANNCHTNQDIYARCPSDFPDPPFLPPSQPGSPPEPAMPPPPPHPPFAPMPFCASACAAGSSCGICLHIVQGSACPDAIEIDALPSCDIAMPGALCEGDGECLTDPTLNSCHGYHDVYRREACLPTATQEFRGGAAQVPPTVVVLTCLALALLVALPSGWWWRHRKRPAKATTTASVPPAATGSGVVKVKDDARLEALVVRNAL